MALVVITSAVVTAPATAAAAVELVMTNKAMYYIV